MSSANTDSRPDRLVRLCGAGAVQRVDPSDETEDTRGSVNSTTTSTLLEVPLKRRIQLLHGYIQLLADAAGVHVLHLKGAAVHPELQVGERNSVDVDVLVRPSQVDVLIEAFQQRGWIKVTGFEEGSAFGHAMNLRHDLGLVDVHRKWPGFDMDTESAFDLLWSRRQSMEIANIACAVPSKGDQRLILLMHFARSGGARRSDLDTCWTDVSPAERADVTSLAAEFHAEMALAAATGDLEQYRGRPGYRLWKYFSRGSGGRMEEWAARFAAARGTWAKIVVVRGFFRVNHDLLTAEIGHEPTRRDYAAAYWERIATAVRETAVLVQSAWARTPR